MDLQRLSSNLISVIDEVLKNQDLVNLIGNDGDNPSSTNILAKTIAPKGVNERILPYPFDLSFKGDVRSQLHIYYPRVSFVNNGQVGKVMLMFDIVVHKNIWLYVDNGKKLIRPYQMLKHLVDSFKDKRVKGVGEIHIADANHIYVNEEFECIRVIANFTEF